MIATIVDTQALGRSVVAAIASGVGVTLIFALTLWSASRWIESQREGRGALAAAFAGLAIAGLAAFAAAVALGIVVMTHKS